MLHLLSLYSPVQLTDTFAMARPESQISEPPVRPPNFKTTPAAIAADMEAVITKTKNLVNKLSKSQPGHEHTFANTILPFLHDENARSGTTRQLHFYKSSTTDDGLRQASREASQAFADFDSEIYSNKDFYRVVSAVKSLGEDLDPEYERYLDDLLTNFKQNGCSLENEAFDRYVKLSLEYNAYSIRAFKNLDQDESGIWLDRDELEGMPSNFFEIREQKTTDPEKAGRFWITGKVTDWEPILQYAKNPETRKRVYLMRAHVSKGNITLYQDVLCIRDEQARLLGYANHASAKLAMSTKRHPRDVIQQLEDLRTALQPQRDAELALLSTLKCKDLNLDDEKTQMYLWDYPYYSRMHSDQVSQASKAEIAEYFPFDYCLSKQLQMFERIFSLKIAPYKPSEGDTWHSDVKLYAVWDKLSSGKSFLGWLYIDPYPRPSKYRHFGHYSVKLVGRSLGDTVPVTDKSCRVVFRRLVKGRIQHQSS
jgi:metallopeptidase MepB